jgi:hypothetical protein
MAPSALAPDMIAKKAKAVAVRTRRPGRDDGMTCRSAMDSLEEAVFDLHEGAGKIQL